MNTTDYLKQIRQTSFALSAPTLKLCPPDMGYEVAFAGRSNAGKSSAINTITHQKQLARSSKTPGRTQMINFFNVGSPNSRIVDLPGYGYAQVPEAMKIKWQKELENYLVHRESLVGLILLTDIRHPLKYFDEQMLHWAKDGDLPVHVLLTKADKLKRGAQKTTLLQTKKQLSSLDLPFSIQLFSALDKEGIDELANVLGNWLHLDNDLNIDNKNVENDASQNTYSTNHQE
ncbi:ribosome biogenesis GTP-binding protein YihA/YsxC [Moraxella oblonga]|uniref:ribosome biogenesis GTP-binding protein YihA/YsxC n=1 Tax=Moraxella oblonga TaxID=200413 RepID=UPI00082F86DF|nr:ribosome biogenesis GTP-binding protein YihA/YsxC [Moraxella oblonga]